MRDLGKQESQKEFEPYRLVRADAFVQRLHPFADSSRQHVGESQKPGGDRHQKGQIPAPRHGHGTFEKLDPHGELVLTRVPAGAEPIEDRVAEARASCGWDLAVAPNVQENAAPTKDEIEALRSWDPRGWFLRER